MISTVLSGEEATAGDYISLLKPRVMTLVVFTGLAGMLVAPGGLHPVLGLTALIAIAVASGAAGAINMWFDRDIDAVMTRTKHRPLPQGRIYPESALQFGVGLSVAAVALMGTAVNWTAAALLAGAVLFYVFIYTIWLKRRTPQNIVIGGAAGAFPPVIGWAAVTGSTDLAAWSLFLIIFLWTPPHFWALALYRDGDYEKAGVPMLPVVAGRDETYRQIILYSLILTPAALVPTFLGLAGMIYFAGALVLSLGMVAGAFAVKKGKDDRSAKFLFGYSVLYLFALFALLIVDASYFSVLDIAHV